MQRHYTPWSCLSHNMKLRDTVRRRICLGESKGGLATRQRYAWIRYEAASARTFSSVIMSEGNRVILLVRGSHRWCSESRFSWGAAKTSVQVVQWAWTICAAPRVSVQFVRGTQPILASYATPQLTRSSALSSGSAPALGPMDIFSMNLAR